MKVLFVVGGLPFGGIENLLFDISLELRRRSVSFKVINISGTGEKTKEFLEAGLPVVNLGNSKKSLKTFRLDTAFKLRKLIKDYKPDVIHSMHFSADYFSRISSVGLSFPKIITHIHTINRERRLERRVLNKLLSYKTDVFLSASKAIFNVVEMDHNIAGRPHYVLYNAINPSRFEYKSKIPKSLVFGNEFKNIVCVGRLVKMKNFDIAIKAFAILGKKLSNVRLIIVGEGKERKNLEALIDSLGLNGKVILTGYLSNVFPILERSHVLLMPSSFEGFPIAHLEAMYAGLPAVISPYVPSQEVASECSLIVPIDPEKIANALNRLLTDEQFYKKLSLRAKEIAKQFTIERYVDKLLDLYDGVLSGKLPSRMVL